MGSYLWSWHLAQATVSPSQIVDVVSTRSMTFSTLVSSGILPPSLLYVWFLLNADASRCCLVLLGSMSPARISLVNWSNLMLLLRALMSQSRQGHMLLVGSFWNPSVSA